MDIHVARCAVRSSNERKLLLIRRTREQRAYPGLWECPGGKLDSENSLQIALARELSEETGLDIIVRQDHEFIEVDRHLVVEGVLAGKTYVTHFITGVDVSRKRAKLGDDHDACVWVDYDEALTYDLTPQTRKGLIALAQKLKAPD